MKHKTISDIAREAGVSKATVSRVLTHPELVKPATQERVKRVMEKHEYVPNHIAQSLAGNPTKMIGVVIDELSNFFFIEVAVGGVEVRQEGTGVREPPQRLTERLHLLKQGLGTESTDRTHEAQLVSLPGLAHDSLPCGRASGAS
mgnify:CR=1 FL=1